MTDLTRTESADAALEALDLRIRTLLPEEYQDTYQDLQPVPMKSAGLKYGVDGQVAWHEMWASFCDLAMAGGPPHKGALLQAGRRADVAAQPERYRYVAAEICRGIQIVTGLDAEPSPVPGWVRVACLSEGMAGWLVRAIVMENVAVRSRGAALDLPARPDFRLEKEIKNVVTVVAKTSHYWMGHIPRLQKRAIADLLATITEEAPLITPALSDDGRRSRSEEAAHTRMAAAILEATGLQPSPHHYAGWLGFECPTVRGAIWMMRALVVSNVLARREGTVLFVPVNPAADPDGSRTVTTLAGIHRLAGTQGVLSSPGARTATVNKP